MLTHLLKLSNAPEAVERAFEACVDAITDNPNWFEAELLKVDTNRDLENMTAVEKEGYAELLRWIKAEINFRQLPEAVVIEIT